MLAGWASGSKYPLLGSVRASSQVVCYEAALGMTIVMVVLVTGSLDPAGRGLAVERVLELELSSGLGFLPFIFFMIAITAELDPAALRPHRGGHRVGGFHTEYSSIRFAPSTWPSS